MEEISLYLNVILGGLLTISEILPLINKIKANGLLDFLVKHFLKKSENLI